MELTPDALVAYLRQRYFNDREIGHPDDIAHELYPELRRAGYDTVEGLAAMLDRTDAALMRDERENPPANARRYAAMGAVRVSMRLDGEVAAGRVSRHRTLDDKVQARSALEGFLGRFPAGSVRSLDDNPQLGLGLTGWLLELDGLFCLVRVPQTDSTIMLLRAGIAIDIPRSQELAEHVAGVNRKLMAGRAYMQFGNDVALVVFEELLWGKSVALDFQPSVQDLVDRFSYVIGQAPEAQATIMQRFGGRPFSEMHILTLADLQ